ncbi:Pho80p cyclin [Leucoagaricus gongylophorus]
MLQRLMNHNDKIPLSPENLTRFHTRSIPSISVLDYLKRIVRFTNIEKACLLLTLHYIDQISARQPTFIFTSLTCHRFIISAITASSKGLCDAFCTNQLYAKVGGITVMELNTLEREFLSVIDWRLMSTREVLNEYYTNLVRTHSSGRYILAGVSTSPIGSESDIDIDSGQSREPSPEAPTSPTCRSAEPTAILIDLGSHVGAPRATLEQNIAFAALQQSQHQYHQNPS